MLLLSVFTARAQSSVYRPTDRTVFDFARALSPCAPVRPRSVVVGIRKTPDAMRADHRKYGTARVPLRYRVCKLAVPDVRTELVDGRYRGNRGPVTQSLWLRNPTAVITSLTRRN
ncbi:Hypothetical protein CINCED_3A007951 [Cinara cedri]|uniref:Uncharacterized protein n=1 Tax=Cinara cedri TaxID=506608 RepID=A0A5E4N7P1_9HEMI|nr:Hypothetical protein CINCED_3A007951 [Cinara cedri]